ncbi:hypothetical protein ACFSSA_04870 [Luteolibacter algae]|uniref:Uncharacterized protein n=1 Tax=Luteolibacter algae TaxID=454151 RepID=A0ABW5D8J3_9BACT
MSSSGLLLRNLLILLMLISPLTAEVLPKALVDAEEKYSTAVHQILSKASSEAEARKNLSKLNDSFLNHLREISPKLLAEDRRLAPEIEQRIELIKGKRDHALEVATLDARLALQMLRNGDEVVTAAKVPALGEKDMPIGELNSKSDGEKVKIGNEIVLEGKGKNIPDDHQLQVFGMPYWNGLFPVLSPQTPERRFDIARTVSETWKGPVKYYLLSVPQDVMTDVRSYMVLRRQWEADEFEPSKVPSFRGGAAENIYLQTLIDLGAVKLGEVSFEIVE